MAHLLTEVVADFGDLDAGSTMVYDRDCRLGVVLLFFGSEDLVDEDLRHPSIGFVVEIDHARGNADFELRPFFPEVFDALRHVFEDGSAGAKEHGGDMEAVDAFLALFFDEGFEDFGRNTFEFIRRNLSGMKQGNGVDGLIDSFAQALGEAAEAEGGFGPIGAVVGDEVADFAHEVRGKIGMAWRAVQWSNERESILCAGQGGDCFRKVRF